MRAFVSAAALVLAVPAHAQYFVSIEGQGVFDANRTGSAIPADILNTYGETITYSASFRLDRGIQYTPGLAYQGLTLSVMINGIEIPLLGAEPVATLSLSPDGADTNVLLAITNVTEPRPTDEGLVFGLFQMLAAPVPGNAIPDLLTATPKLPFYFLTIGGTDGTAVYSFELTDFSVSGTQPPITPFVPTPPPAPEPATWAMLIGGFGVAGGVMRRRRPRLAHI